MVIVPPSPQTRFTPRPPAYARIPRPRLHAAAGSPCTPIVVIHGPAGYGKSTLAAQLAENRGAAGHATTWLRLDADDDAPAWFIAHLIEALGPAIGDAAGDLLARVETASGDPAPALLPDLIRVLDGTSRPVTLVLDDAQHLAGDTVTSCLSRLADAAGACLHLIITTRSIRTLPLARWRVSGHMIDLDAAELRFSAAETAEFLSAVHGIDLAAREVAAIHSGTDGWPAALQLAALALRRFPDPTALLEGLAHRDSPVGDYLADDVIAHLPADVREALPPLAVPRKLCAELAAELTGAADGAALLRDIHDRGLFIDPIDASGRWFRLHQLPRSFLLDRLRAADPEGHAELHRRCARWFADGGDPVEAVEHALAVGDHGLATDIVRAEALCLVEHARMTTLLTLVDRLGPGAPGDDLTLLVAVAWSNCLLRRRSPTDAALARIDALLAAGAPAPPEFGDPALVAVEAQVIRQCSLMYADAVDGVGEMEEAVARHADHLRPWVNSVAANVATFARLNGGRPGEALAVQERARPHHDATTGSFSRIYGLCLEGLAHYRMLDCDAAEDAFRRAHEVGMRMSGGSVHGTRLAAALLGGLRYVRGDGEEAVELLERGHALGREGGIADFLMVTYAYLARHLLDTGDRDAAAAVLHEGMDIGQRCRLPRVAARMRVGLARLGRCRPPAVDAAIAATAPALAERTRELNRIADALGAITCPGAEDPRPALAEALAWCRRAHRGTGPDDGGLRRLQLRLLETSLALAIGEPGADRLVRDVVVRIEHVGLVRFLDNILLVVPDALPIVAGAVRDTVPGGACDRFLRARGADPAHAPAGRAAHAVPAADPSPAAPRVSPAAAPAAAPEPAGRGAARAAGADTAAGGAPDPDHALSPREVDILLLVERGLANRDIAGQLHLGVNTVKWYLKRLFSRFGCSTRAECVVAARDAGLLTPR